MHKSTLTSKYNNFILHPQVVSDKLTKIWNCRNDDHWRKQISQHLNISIRQSMHFDYSCSLGIWIIWFWRSHLNDPLKISWFPQLYQWNFPLNISNDSKGYYLAKDLTALFRLFRPELFDNKHYFQYAMLALLAPLVTLLLPYCFLSVSNALY